MNNPKLSALFPMSTEPTHEGVYKVKYANYPHMRRYSLFKDGHWHLVDDTPDKAAKSFVMSKDCYSGTISGWQGIARKVKC